LVRVHFQVSRNGGLLDFFHFFLFNSSDLSAVFFFLRQTCVGRSECFCWTYVRHSCFCVVRRFVGSSELFRQDFRPPLVFLLDSCRLERVLPAGLSSATRRFPFARLFVGWIELFRQDFRPPLVCLLSRMPSLSGHATISRSCSTAYATTNRFPEVSSTPLDFKSGVDGVFTNQPFVSSFTICREELVDQHSAASLPASVFDSARNNQPLFSSLPIRREKLGVSRLRSYRFPFSPPFYEVDAVRTRKLAFVVEGSSCPETIFVSKCGYGRGSCSFS